MSFFQPGPSTTGTTATPSPAAQALAQAKLNILSQLLNSAASPQPTFASYAGGGPSTRSLPGGLGDLLGPALTAMQQPGAFTSSGTGTQQGPTPSTFSDITQLGLLGALLYPALKDSGALGAGGDILSGGIKNLAGFFHLPGFSTGPADLQTPTLGNSPGLTAGTPYAGNPPELIPGGGNVPVSVNYPSDPGGGNYGYGFDQAMADLISSGILG
jgi:hypothetical protein